MQKFLLTGVETNGSIDSIIKIRGNTEEIPSMETCRAIAEIGAFILLWAGILFAVTALSLIQIGRGN